MFQHNPGSINNANAQKFRDEMIKKRGTTKWYKVIAPICKLYKKISHYILIDNHIDKQLISISLQTKIYLANL